LSINKKHPLVIQAPRSFTPKGAALLQA